MPLPQALKANVIQSQASPWMDRGRVAFGVKTWIQAARKAMKFRFGCRAGA